MEVLLRRLCFGLCALTLLAALGCRQESKTPQDTFEKESPQCSETAITNRFVVQWRDGHTTVESGPSRQQFLNDFVAPHLHEINAVEYDHLIHLPQSKNMAAQALTSGPVDDWGVVATNVASAWQQGLRGDGVIVAVVDSGVDRQHELLKDRIYQNPGEIGTDASGQDKRFNGIDDDKNGFVDDYEGFNFVTENGDIEDTSHHGTHVSGIIAADHTDTTPTDAHVQGMAPGATIMPLQFIDGEEGTVGDAITAIKYARDHGARIINASWGGTGCSPILADVINSLAQDNILFVSAAGNDGIDIDSEGRYPASYDLANQITVGAIGPTLFMEDFSNYGSREVHLFAPGFNIYSTVPGDQIDVMSGTSMATPFVSGAAALLWQKRPDATFIQIKQALLTGVDQSSSYINSSQGRLDVAKALTALENL